MQGNTEQLNRAEQVLSGSQLSRHDIGRIVVGTFGVSYKECRLHTRGRQFVRARWAAWYLMLELKPGSSWLQMAQVFLKDHTSAINGIEQAEQLLRLDANFAMMVGKARAAIKSGGRAPDDVVQAVDTAGVPKAGKNSKTPPALKSAPPIVFSNIKPSHALGIKEMDDRVSRWWRENDERFCAAMMAAYPPASREGGAK